MSHRTVCVGKETMCDETAKGECCPKQLCMRSKKAKAAIRDCCCGKADLKRLWEANGMLPKATVCEK